MLSQFSHYFALDVETKTKKIKKCSTCSLDVSMSINKRFSDNLSDSLSLLFNQISYAGQFQNCWKIGFIIRVKNSNEKDFDGVHTITVTPVSFYKLYESYLAV